MVASYAVVDSSDSFSNEQSVAGAKVGRREFTALGRDVAEVIASRPAQIIYGYLATRWFEYAAPEKIAALRKTGSTIVPGAWVSVSYRELMGCARTSSRGSVIRWLRLLAEEEHACPWTSGCGMHPLIVIRREGRGQNNRYRRWSCDSDVLMLRRRVRSTKLAAVAQRRTLDQGLSRFGVSNIDVLPAASFDCAGEPQSDDRQSHDRTTASLARDRLEVSCPDVEKSHTRTSLRTKEQYSKNKTTAAKPLTAAAAIEINEVDAVACQVTGTIYTLARRHEPEYLESQAVVVAERLAEAALEITGGDSSRARRLLDACLVDRRLTVARNPVGLLIRGVLGDANGADRFLVATANVMPICQSRPLPATVATTDDRVERERSLAAERQYSELTLDERDDLQTRALANLGTLGRKLLRTSSAERLALLLLKSEM